MDNSRIHAFGPDILADHDAVAVADLVRCRQVSQLEVVQAAIARVERVNPALNAVQVSDYERALTQAARGQSGLLGGVPTFVKDNVDLQGLPTGHGSRAVSGAAVARDDSFLEQFRSLGFHLLGKTTLPEFGFNSSTEYQGRPPTRNPWHTGYSCGGSSGGSAALVAAGAVPLAHGNDGGGSIRIPAACCGLVWLKPSRGRLRSADLTRGLPVQIVVEGVLTRTVRDTALFFAGAEQDWRNRKLPPIGLVEGPADRRLRIGLVTGAAVDVPTCAETHATVEATARLLESLGHRVEHVVPRMPASFAEDFSDYWSFIAYCLSRFGQYRLGKPFDSAKLSDLTRGLAARFRRHRWRLPLMLWRLKRIAWQHVAAAENSDVVLSPVQSHVAPELGYLSPEVPFDELFERLSRYVAFTPLSNANGTPAISLPMGATSNGLPIGIQLSAAYGQERTLLEVAYELEQAKPWRRITGA
jgi:amidase